MGLVLTCRHLVGSRPARAARRVVESSLNDIAGRDPLGLNTISTDRVRPQLLPGILQLSERAQYFSIYPWMLSQFAQRRRPPTTDFDRVAACTGTGATLLGYARLRSGATRSPRVLGPRQFHLRPDDTAAFGGPGMQPGKTQRRGRAGLLGGRPRSCNTITEHSPTSRSPQAARLSSRSTTCSANWRCSSTRHPVRRPSACFGADRTIHRRRTRTRFRHPVVD